MKIKPLNDKIVIKRFTEEQKNGLYIPESSQEKKNIGEVIAVGKGKIENNQLVPLDVNVGDIVIFGSYSGNEVEIEKEKFVILRESDLLAILDK